MLLQRKHEKRVATYHQSVQLHTALLHFHSSSCSIYLYSSTTLALYHIHHPYRSKYHTPHTTTANHGLARSVLGDVYLNKKTISAASSIFQTRKPLVFSFCLVYTLAFVSVGSPTRMCFVLVLPRIRAVLLELLIDFSRKSLVHVFLSRRSLNNVYGSFAGHVYLDRNVTGR